MILVILCADLSISFFITTWTWPISVKLDKLAVVSKVLSSYRFHADKQQHNCSHWGKDCRLGSFFVGYQRSYTNEFCPRRGCYPCPRCKKSGKGVCSFLNVSFWPGDTKLGKESLGLCLVDYLFNKIVLVLCSSSHLRLRAGSSWQGKAPAHRQSKAPQSSMWFGMWLFRNSFYSFCCRDRWQERKGRQKEGSR